MSLPRKQRPNNTESPKYMGLLSKDTGLIYFLWDPYAFCTARLLERIQANLYVSDDCSKFIVIFLRMYTPCLMRMHGSDV